MAGTRGLPTTASAFARDHLIRPRPDAENFNGEINELKLDGYRVQAQAACVMSLTVLRRIPAMAAGITDRLCRR